MNKKDLIRTQGLVLLGAILTYVALGILEHFIDITLESLITTLEMIVVVCLLAATTINLQESLLGTRLHLIPLFFKFFLLFYEYLFLFVLILALYLQSRIYDL